MNMAEDRVLAWQRTCNSYRYMCSYRDILIIFKSRSVRLFFCTNCTKIMSKIDLWQIFKVVVIIYGHPVLHGCFPINWYSFCKIILTQ